MWKIPSDYLERQSEIIAKDIEGQVDGLLTAALEQLSIDMHQISSRPCPTCRAMSKALKKPFGCYAWQKKLGVLKETFS